MNKVLTSVLIVLLLGNIIMGFFLYRGFKKTDEGSIYYQMVQKRNEQLISGIEKRMRERDSMMVGIRDAISAGQGYKQKTVTNEYYHTYEINRISGLDSSDLALEYIDAVRVSDSLDRAGYYADPHSEKRRALFKGKENP